jgi:hypothetical protein
MVLRCLRISASISSGVLGNPPRGWFTVSPTRTLSLCEFQCLPRTSRTGFHGEHQSPGQWVPGERSRTWYPADMVPMPCRNTSLNSSGLFYIPRSADAACENQPPLVPLPVQLAGTKQFDRLALTSRTSSISSPARVYLPSRKPAVMSAQYRFFLAPWSTSRSPRQPVQRCSRRSGGRLPLIRRRRCGEGRSLPLKSPLVKKFGLEGVLITPVRKPGAPARNLIG